MDIQNRTYKLEGMMMCLSATEDVSFANVRCLNFN